MKMQSDIVFALEERQLSEEYITAQVTCNEIVCKCKRSTKSSLGGWERIPGGSGHVSSGLEE